MLRLNSNLVLDVLRICLSVIIPNITVSKNKKSSFAISDIKLGTAYLQASCNFEVSDYNFNLLIVKQRESFKDNKSEDFRDNITKLLDVEKIGPSLKKKLPTASKSAEQPIAVFYSTKRSLITEKEASKSAAIGGQAVAFAEALSDNRAFNLKTFAQWFKVQQALGEETPLALKHIEVMKNAVSLFLPHFSNLDIIETDGELNFTIEKAGVVLSIQQLSDGERGVLALVLDIARRLSQANPGLENPLRDGNGIILIDELDLHLHPKWQRSIVENLTRVFPNCQFIVTTHSPQIIGEVKPDFITVIDNGTHRPANSFGVDSSRVLEEILDTAPRNKDVDILLNKLYKSIDEEKLDNAKEQIAQLILVLGPNDPEITRSTTMVSFLEDNLADETNKEK
jgi:predicted ATP-binding protein involved in virulence